MMTKKILLFLSTVLLFISCDKRSEIIVNQGIGNVSLSFSNEDLQQKSANIATPDAILITIKDPNGETVINNQKLTLISFGSSYITEEIELIVGDYSITSFNIVDANNTIIYASPIEGSEMAEFVNDPLPIAFTVTEGDTSTISPEVIYVGPTVTPEQFGYTSFSFTIVDIPTEPQGLYLAVYEDIDVTTASKLDGASYNLNIPDNNNELTLYGDIIDGQIFIEIENLADYNNRDIVLDITHPNYINQTLTLNTNELANYTEDNPFVVSLEKILTTSDTLSFEVLISSISNSGESYSLIWGNAYSYTTELSNESGHFEIINDDSNKETNTFEVPFTNVNETYFIKIYHGDYTGYKELVLTYNEIIALANTPAPVVSFDENSSRYNIFDNNVNTSLWFMAFDNDQGGNLTSFFYTLLIDGSQYDEGYSYANDNFYIVDLPTDYTSLELNITTPSGKKATIPLTYEEAQEYTVNPLQFQF